MAEAKREAGLSNPAVRLPRRKTFIEFRFGTAGFDNPAARRVSGLIEMLGLIVGF